MDLPACWSGGGLRSASAEGWRRSTKMRPGGRRLRSDLCFHFRRWRLASMASSAEEEKRRRRMGGGGENGKVGGLERRNVLCDGGRN
nr:hypothetical protein Itr_chr03CG01910 [Ipomoea trifida]